MDPGNENEVVRLAATGVKLNMPRRAQLALAGTAVLLGGLGWAWIELAQSVSVSMPGAPHGAPGPPYAGPVGIARDLTWGSGNAERHEVVLRGHIFGTSGEPFANSSVFLVPAYVGSGPARIEARTDDGGSFAFPPFILARFELVPRSLDDWHPRTPGNYLRIPQTPEAWLSTAEAGRDIELHAESYTLVPVTLDLSAFRSKYVQVWITRGGVFDSGSSYRAEEKRVTLALEEGVPAEVWAQPRNDQNVTSLSNLGKVRPLWSGTPHGPVTIPTRSRQRGHE